MASTSLVHSRLLDVLFGVSAGPSLLLGLGLLVGGERPEGLVQGVLLVVLVGVLTALWWVRRRRTGQASFTFAVVFAAVATSVTVVAESPVSLPVLFFAALLLVLDVGARAGAVLLLVVLSAQAAVFLTVLRPDPAETISEVAAAAALFAYAFALAVVLRGSTRENAERAVLLRQRDAANAQLREANTLLEEANSRLRRGIETEKELVLARERARSARELHDGLGHRLTLIKLGLDVAKRRRASDPGQAWSEVESARTTTLEAIAEMRLWVRALSPVSVEGLQGAAALDAVAESFRGTGVEVSLKVTGEERPMPEEVLLFCHRFVQEGLTNALRHARPRAVRIGLDYHADDVMLTVSDDGGAVPSVTPGFGLRSLKERAQELGGTVQARPGECGVVLTATVPSGAVSGPLVLAPPDARTTSTLPAVPTGGEP